MTRYIHPHNSPRHPNPFVRDKAVRLRARDSISTLRDLLDGSDFDGRIRTAIRAIQKHAGFKVRGR